MSTVFAPEYPRSEEGWVRFPSDVEYRREVFPVEVNKHTAKANVFLIQSCIEYVSEPGQTILDPMAGTGTLMIGALVGRTVINIEISPKFYALQELARDRLAEIAPGSDNYIMLLNQPCQLVLPIPHWVDHIIFSPPYAGIMKSKGKDKLTTEKTDYDMAEYCCHPRTPVLKADLTWVSNGDLKPGDELIGYEEFARTGRHRKLVKSIVEENHPIDLPSYEIVLTDHRSVICNGEHKWLVLDDYGYTSWVRTDNLKPGSRIRQICEPWETDTSYSGAYLSGFFDGEGNINGSQAGIHVGFGLKNGETFNKVISFLESKGLLNNQLTPRHKIDMTYYQCGDIAQSLRLLGTIRPERLIKNLIWEGKELGKNNPTATVDYVVPAGVQRLCAMRTSTKTFFANGLVSHNTFTHPLNLGLMNDWMWAQKMEEVYKKCFDTLKPGGTMTIILKDHMEKRQRVGLTQAAVDSCKRIGFELFDWQKWLAPGSVYTHIYRSRGWEVVDDENIVFFRRP